MGNKKEVVVSKNAPPASGPYSRAVKYGDLVFISGLSPRGANGEPFRGTFEEQVTNVLDNIGVLLNESGSSFEKVLKLTVILKDTKNRAQMNEIFKRYFTRDPPARTTFQAPLGAEIEVEAIAGT